jgi:hypothetical protein
MLMAILKHQRSRREPSRMGDLIFEVNQGDETKEEFDRRVDMLAQKSKERTGKEPVVFKMIIAEKESTAHVRNAVVGEGA